MNFWDTYENAHRVLVIPNYTFGEDYNKDSFVDVLSSQIKALGNDYFWIIPVITPVKKFNLPNVDQRVCNISGNVFWMRSNFPTDIKKLLRGDEYDVVYSHLSDWHIGRYTNKPIIGYSHWWEMKECNSHSWLNRSRNIPHEIVNILDYKVCFTNTLEQKKAVIENAKEWFNDETIQRLDTIVQVMNLGVSQEKICDFPSNDYDKVIVFNHRTNSYKGWDRFIKWMEKYRETRQDFVVWAPLLDSPNKWSWVDTTKYDKETYYKKLSQSCVGVTPRQDHMGWSVSSTDSMMCGLPVLFQEQDCYKEIMEDGLTFKNQRELFTLLDKMLDDKSFRMEWAEKGIEGARKLTNVDDENIHKLHSLLMSK